jgi:hypothetical protein
VAETAERKEVMHPLAARGIGLGGHASPSAGVAGSFNTDEYLTNSRLISVAASIRSDPASARLEKVLKFRLVAPATSGDYDR